MFHKKNKIEGIINEINGVEANALYEIEVITTKDEIHIISNKKEHKAYRYEEMSMLYVDKDHLCLAFGSVKYMIWVQNSHIDLYELEREIKESVKNAKLNRDTKLQGVAEKVEKKEKRSYRKQLGIVLLIVVLICFCCTIGYTFVNNKGDELLNLFINNISNIFVENKSNSENEKIEYLESSYEQLTETKQDISNLKKLINSIIVDQSKYGDLKSEMAKIQMLYDTHKITSFKLDTGYLMMPNNNIKTKSKEIYRNIDNLFDVLNEYLVEENEQLSKYVLLEADINKINEQISSLQTSIILEIQQF